MLFTQGTHNANNLTTGWQKQSDASNPTQAFILQCSGCVW